MAEDPRVTTSSTTMTRAPFMKKRVHAAGKNTLIESTPDENRILLKNPLRPSFPRNSGPNLRAGWTPLLFGQRRSHSLQVSKQVWGHSNEKAKTCNQGST